MILKAFSTSEENFGVPLSTAPRRFGGHEAEACSWRKAQGAQRPRDVLGRGEPSCSQRWTAVGERQRPLPRQRLWWKNPTLSCAALGLCEHDACHRYSKLISWNYTGRPCVSVVCSWAAAHTYFSTVLNGKKCMSLWLDVTYESARASAWYAAQTIAAVLKQGSDGYARNNLPPEYQTAAQQKIFWHNWSAFQTWNFGSWRISGKG